MGNGTVGTGTGTNQKIGTGTTFLKLIGTVTGTSVVGTGTVPVPEEFFGTGTGLILEKIHYNQNPYFRTLSRKKNILRGKYFVGRAPEQISLREVQVQNRFPCTKVQAYACFEHSNFFKVNVPLSHNTVTVL